jgi:L-threonylcarbamoyladenylate synthase
MPTVPATPSISDAVTELRSGRLLAIPTETVYGLAADARNVEAVQRIFQLKGRPNDHPLIVHIAGAAQLPEWAIDVPETAYRLAAAFWPGPLTLILNKRPDVPDAVTGGQDTVGLRCPDNALTLELLRAFNGGLAAPSANRFGRISPTTAEHVRAEFGGDTPMILDGGSCTVGIESTIVDLSRHPARILRHGHIRHAQLLPFLPGLLAESGAQSPRVSGSLQAHYAPRTPLFLRSRSEIESDGTHNAVVLALDRLPPGRRGLALPSQAEDYAQGLYAALRALDAMAAGCIWLERLPESPAWLAVNDRVNRAVAGSG